MLNYIQIRPVHHFHSLSVKLFINTLVFLIGCMVYIQETVRHKLYVIILYFVTSPPSGVEVKSACSLYLHSLIYLHGVVFNEAP